MPRWIRKVAIGTIYTLAGMLFFVGFLAATFPRQTVLRWVMTQAERMSGLEITAREAVWHFPAGLEWREMSLRTRTGLEVRLESVLLSPRLGSILRRRPEVAFEAAGFGGTTAGWFKVEPNSGSDVYRLSGAVQEVDLSLALVPFGLADLLKGKVRLTGQDLEWKGNDWQRTKGAVLVEASDLRILPADLDLSSLTGRLVFRSGVGSLEHLIGHGAGLDLTGSGTLLFREPAEDSLLNLTLRVQTQEGVKLPAALALMEAMRGGTGSRGVTEVAVRGPLKRPSLLVNGMPLMQGFGNGLLKGS
jgi:type II secretion system protein N